MLIQVERVYECFLLIFFSISVLSIYLLFLLHESVHSFMFMGIKLIRILRLRITEIWE